MSFLSNMFEKKKGKYCSIAVARSALSAILPKVNGKKFGKNDRISRMIKKILKLHPSLPKYVVTYDPNIILQYTDLLPANNRLSMDLLTKKLWILFCLLSGQRSQTITSIKIGRSVLAHIEDIYSTSMQFKKKKKSDSRETSNPFGVSII